MATTKVLSARIAELEGELTLCRAAMGNVVSVVKFGLGKDKLESSKSKERSICEGNHKEDDNGGGNGNDGGNRKPRVGKKPNKKRGKLKYFLCDGPHMLKKYPKKSVLSKKKKSEGKALRLGSSATGVAKMSEEVYIEEDNASDKESKKLSLNKGKVEAKRAKRSKKKRVKCFLCCGSHELRNYPKPIRLNLSKVTELVESSVRLPPMEEVSLALDLEKEVAMQNLKLGSMKLNFVDTSRELPLLREVDCASNFGKVMMQVG
ncbi:hypothetical protein J1N35_041012 [Gossypium stocksii]|uniref:Uncharacterized protein n=1 Tax=Gossypium stocksii TaxID=47602 RepID=A0A9D3ZJB7_9ROSI|nr:hypothetical protein J1N35_041012 [Gossypium stocksii]